MTNNKIETIFDGSNFTQWQESATIHLKTKGLFQFVRENASTAAEDRDKEEEAQARLLSSIGKRYRKPSWFAASISARTIWTDMESPYGTVNTDTLAAERMKFATITFGSVDQLPEIINQLERCQSRTVGSECAIQDVELCIQLFPFKSFGSNNCGLYT